MDARLAGRFLAERAGYLGEAGWALADLGESEPVTAAQLGLEVASLEARLLLEAGSLDRISRLGIAAPQVDLGRMERLETLVRMAEGRVTERLAALEASEGSRPWQSLAGAVSLAGGIVSIARQLF